MAQGALTFGAATSDRVDVGLAAAFNYDPITIAGWFMPTTLTTQRNLFSVQGATVGSRFLRLSGTTGDLMFGVTRVTTNTSYTTNTTPLATLNAWAFIMATFNSGASAGQIVNIYRGDLQTAPTECTYGAATDGAGALIAPDAPGTSRIGNSMVGTAAFQGRIGPIGVWNAELTAADAVSLWRIMRSQTRGVTGKGFWRLGNEGTGAQQDYTGTGNTGTVTGATQSDGPPVGAWWTQRAA